MRKSNYVICRDDLYIGTVIKTNKRNIITDNKTGKLKIFSFEKYRSILFTPNEFGLAEDLIYNSPEYPIQNITDSRLFFSYKNEITLIYDAYNLSKLLEYLGYNLYLTHKDIIRIRKTLFNGKFTIQNPDIFEEQEIIFENLDFYIDGEKITNIKELEKLKWQLLSDKSKNSFIKAFKKHNDALREFEHIINSKSDNSIMDVILRNELRTNNFLPHPNEIKVKLKNLI